MIETKQVNTKKNKYHTINTNDLVSKKDLLKTLIFITLITFKKILITATHCVKKMILLKDIKKKMMKNI